MKVTRLLWLAVMLLIAFQVPVIAQEGDTFPAAVHSGSCEDDPGAVVAELAGALLPDGNQIGSDAAQTAATSFVTVPVSLDALVASDHAIVVESGGETAACGEVGGMYNDAGALVIVLSETRGSGVSGIAYLGRNVADQSQTDVSLFVAGVPEPDPLAEVQSAAGEADGPAPTPTFEEQVAGFVPLADVRELAIRTGNLVGDTIVFSGTVMTISVASEGRAFILGDDDPRPYGAQIQVQVPAPDGTTEYVFVGYDGDTTGIFEGTWVTVYATVVDTQTFENSLGGGVTQPLVDAEFVLVG